MAKSKSRSDVKVEHLAEGALAYVIVSGIVDETFEPKQLVAAIRSQQVVLNCAAVSAVSSFGVRQWLSFMDEVQDKADELYLVECSQGVVDQLGIVTGFAGRGNVLSFYAPYVCEDCGASRSVLFRVDQEQEMLKTCEPPTYTCRVCRGTEVLDEDPEAYLAYFQGKTPPKIADDVLALLRARLDYSSASQSSRPHVEKYVQGKTTYVAIRGTLDSRLPINKILAGLEGTVIIDGSSIVFTQQSGLEPWDELMGHLRSTPLVHHTYVAGCPPLALERGSVLGIESFDRLTILSVSMPYRCRACSATAWHMIGPGSKDGSLELDDLPQKKCGDCGGKSAAVVSASLLQKLAQVPQPKAPGKIRRFVASTPKKLEARRRKYSGAGREQRPTRVLVAAIVGGLLAVGGAAAMAAVYLSSKDPGTTQTSGNTVTGGGTANGKNNAAFQRPAWISSDEPGTSYCFDTPVKLYCVGVSAFGKDKPEALLNARNSALEELASLVALRADTPAVLAQRRQFWKARQDALADADRVRSTDPAMARKALEKLSRHRALVAEGFQSNGGPAVPAQQSGSHWEEYELEDKSGTEFLGFARIEISNGAFKVLLDRYSKAQMIGGASVVTALPSAAWKTGEKVDGLYVHNVGDGPLQRAGVSPNQVILSANDEPTTSVAALEAAISAGGKLQVEAFKLE